MPVGTHHSYAPSELPKPDNCYKFQLICLSKSCCLAMPWDNLTCKSRDCCLLMKISCQHAKKISCLHILNGNRHLYFRDFSVHLTHQGYWLYLHKKNMLNWASEFMLYHGQVPAFIIWAVGQFWWTAVTWTLLLSHYSLMLSWRNSHFPLSHWPPCWEHTHAHIKLNYIIEIHLD